MKVGKFTELLIIKQLKEYREKKIPVHILFRSYENIQQKAYVLIKYIFEEMGFTKENIRSLTEDDILKSELKFLLNTERDYMPTNFNNNKITFYDLVNFIYPNTYSNIEISMELYKKALENDGEVSSKIFNYNPEAELIFLECLQYAFKLEGLDLDNDDDEIVINTLNKDFLVKYKLQAAFILLYTNLKEMFKDLLGIEFNKQPKEQLSFF